MTPRAIFLLGILLLFQSCAQEGVRKALRPGVPPPESSPRLLAIYEPWFGHPRHIAVGYSSQDPVVLSRQIDEAKSLGISGFVVDWYGDREPFLDRAYGLLQSMAGKKKFQVAMMYDETEGDNGQATDDAVAALVKFKETYLAADAPGREAYVTYEGRPLIFIFPKGGHTDWKRVKQETDTWNPRPLLIYEDRATEYADAFDGFYAWVNPGKGGWAQDGSHWGEDYLRDFYSRMLSNPKKIAVGAAWPGFDDRKAAWGLGRYISQRCGQTFSDTLRLSREFYPPEHPLPFLLIATWNDYEEGTAIERGLAKCDAGGKSEKASP
jgi:hypothetical protein